MRKNWLTTIGGIMAGCIGIPIAVSTAGYHLPEWLGLIFVILGTLGAVVVGVAAKGQDEHSTADQVELATEKKEAH